MNIATTAVYPNLDSLHKHISQAAPREKVTLAIRITNLFRYVTHSAVSAFKAARPLEPLKLAFLPTIPMAAASIVTTAKSIPGSTMNEQVDSTLGIVAHVGEIGDGVATSTEGLASLGAIARASIAWTGPLFIAGVGFQCAGIILGTKSFVETHRFSTEFGKAAGLVKHVKEYTTQDYINGLNLLDARATKEKSFIAKHFGVDETKLAARLVNLEFKARDAFEGETVDEARKEKYQAKMKNTMERLGKRLKEIKFCKALAVISGVIGVLGVTILLTAACPPVGFALLALSTSLFFIRFFINKEQTSQFEKDMKFHKVVY